MRFQLTAGPALNRTVSLVLYAMKKMSLKEKDILDRIKHLEDAIAKALEYLESGKHADWHGFRPLFVKKIRNGEALPPHKDWVKNVFLPNQEKALRRNQKLLEKLTQ